MSAECVGWVFRHSPYRGTKMLVHLALADIANDVHGYRLWALTKSIAAKARTSPGSARRALVEMVADGYLELVDDRSGSNQASEYRFLMPEQGRAPRATDPDVGRAPRATGRAPRATGSRTTRDGVAHHARHIEQEVEREHEREAEQEPVLDLVLADGAPIDPSAQFDVFYAAFPRHVGRGAAETAWSRAVKRATPGEILLGAERFAAKVRRERTEQRFIPHPATWLNAARWLDEDDTAPAAMIVDRSGESGRIDL